MYQRYLADPASVDPAWHDFFADYKPALDTAAAAPAAAAPARPSANGTTTTTAPAPAPAPAPTTPATPGDGKPAATKTAPVTAAPAGAKTTVLRGVAARIVSNMDDSLSVPTATSVRAVPAKLLADNLPVINNHLARGRGGKVSFTHLIGYALVKALGVHPEMNNSFAQIDGKPTLVQPAHVNLGTTITLTNPDGIGTVHSMPRLLANQGAIVGVGAMEYPAEFSGMSDEAIADAAVSKIITLTST